MEYLIDKIINKDSLYTLKSLLSKSALILLLFS